MSAYYNTKSKVPFDVQELDAPRYVKEWLNYLSAVKNLTPRTVFNYYLCIRTFLRWIIYSEDKKLTFNEIPVAKLPFDAVKDIYQGDIHSYLTFCDLNLSLTATSRAAKLSALKSFYKYLLDMGKIESNPVDKVPSPKMGHPLPKFLSIEECNALLNAINQEDAVPKRNGAPSHVARDYCMILFLMCCGMRVSELVGIDERDIDGDRLLLRGKGRKERAVYLNEPCQNALEAYLAEKSQKPLREGQGAEDPALFISYETMHRITTRRVQQIMAEALLRAGLQDKGYSPHKLRHTTASQLYRSGTDTVDIAEILGHKSLTTTQIYTHVDNDQIRERMQNNVLSNLNGQN